MKKIVKAVGTMGLVGCAAMSSQPAFADDSTWYGGLNIGPTRAKIDNARITSQLLGTGLTTTSMSDDERDFGYKLFGGYKINKNFALEAGYFNLGKFSFVSNTQPPGTLNGSLKASGLNLDAVGILPMTEKFSAFGRIGAQYAQVKDKFAGTGAVAVTDPSPSKSAVNVKIGWGVQYDFTQNVGLRGEWERYRVNDAVGNRGDIDMFSVGLVFNFGGKKPAPATRAETPPPAAPPAVIAAAAPVLVIVPVATRQYCSILDIQFEINEDVIQREEREKIGVVGTFMKKYPNTTAVIEGHTDSVGTNEDNMKLSQRRADSVVNYLVNDLGITRSRLTAVGYGEMRPIADNRTEDGKRLNRRIDAVIACAPDIEGLKVIPARLTMAMEMEFDANKADVKPQYREELRKVANFLKANPGVTATVEGHTGNLQASPELTREIAQRRAQNVVNYLVDNFNVPRSQLAAQGFGQTRRIAYNTSLEGRQENRRVNIIINYPR